MDPTRNDPVADGVEGSADVIEKIASIAQTKATANRPIVAGIAVRRGPGGVAKGGLKAEWSITIADVCVDARTGIVGCAAMKSSVLSSNIATAPSSRRCRNPNGRSSSKPRSRKVVWYDAQPEPASDPFPRRPP